MQANVWIRMLHNHNHATELDTGRSSYGRAFLVSIVLNIGFVAIEATYGILSNSVALIADAGHNLSDVLGLCVAWGATILVKRRPSARYTYGLRRSSILAALFNAVFLLIAVGAIAFEAVRRLGNPQPVGGGTVMAVAGVGIVVNGVAALLFAGGKGDINIRGAFLHMAADAAVSAGVVIAGLVILRTGWVWLDPVVSLVIVAVIVIGTWGLLRDSVSMSLDAVPAGITPGDVTAALSALPGVTVVHDLHVWPMSTTEVALTAHLVRPEGHPGDDFLHDASAMLEARFGIHHCTIQLETSLDEHCKQAPAHSV